MKKLLKRLLNKFNAFMVQDGLEKPSFNAMKFDFECNMSKEYGVYAHHDEWGCATLWSEDGKKGVEYNFCIDSGNDCSAIYKMTMNDEGIAETDYSEYKHYEVDFSKENWEELLKIAMIHALKVLHKMD